MLVLISISVPARKTSPIRFSLVLALYILTDVLYALNYDKTETNILLIVLFFVIKHSKPILFFVILFGKRAFKIVISYYVIYINITSIVTQTVLFALRVPIEYSHLSSASILNWIDCIITAIMLASIFFARRNFAVVAVVRNFSLLPARTMILIFTTIFCMALLENSVLSQMTILDFSSEVSRYSSIFLALLLMGLVLYIVVIVNSNTVFNQTVTNLTDQVNAQVLHYESLKNNDGEMQRFRHDFENIIMCLKVLLKSDNIPQALDYIDDMVGTFNYSKPVFDTGNYIADALLSEKNHKAGQYDTKIEYEGFIPSYRITNFELCIILSNALDNAIEACAKINGEKTIEITSEIKNGIWFLTINNPITKRVTIRNNTVFTTKNDISKHGFGLYNIKKTVQKRNGHLKLSCSDTLFTLDVAVNLTS